MRLPEQLLLLISKNPASADPSAGQADEWSVENALALLYRVFPDFTERIGGKDILDFGCGQGWQSIALAKAGARRVVGIETNPKGVKRARELVARFSLNEQVRIADHFEEDFLSNFDVVISQNSMEHFPAPSRALMEMSSALREGGVILVVFGPPWYAPYGSHMQFITDIPWINVLFDEETLMKVRARYKHDGAKKFEEVEGGLNQMNIAKFERLVSECGLRMVSKKYHGVKGLDFLGRIPLARELFINLVSCVLQKT